MIAQELKRRISLLQRGEAPPGQVAQAERATPPRCADLREHFANGEIVRTACGEMFLCRAGLGEVYSGAAGLARRYSAAFRRAQRLARADALPHFMHPLVGAEPEATALIDTETAGLHGRPVFLIGLLRQRDKSLAIEQYFARTYAEEASILHRLTELLPELKLLVTFNGKAFDWPFVRDRMVYHRVRCEPSFAHLDLLHPSRRRWRSQLPNCRLKTLERYLSGRWRRGDIPSEEIPQRYHDFVRQQDARLIAPILHHNRLDLIAMTELLIALVEGDEPKRAAQQC